MYSTHHDSSLSGQSNHTNVEFLGFPACAHIIMFAYTVYIVYVGRTREIAFNICTYVPRTQRGDVLFL